MAYNTLSRAQLSFEYLHTNSTTHEFLFGALAELLDNARDAAATKINIYTEPDESLRGGFLIAFHDDGEGMDPNETADIVTFGKSVKRSNDLHQIGMYGNGLKSGSMRIGNDLILFTKKGMTMSCLFLSRTFHEEEGIDEVIVPLPSFEASTRRSLAKGVRAEEKHEVEMGLIYKYSPFRTEEEFFDQFDKIEGNSGTLVVVFNLKLLDSGEPELDVKTDSKDILLANPESDFDSDEDLHIERKSFRAYASILYVDPRMRIYIQGQKVRTKRLSCCLYKPKLYKYSSNRFKTRSENEAKRAQDEALQAENKAKEAESKAKNLENKYGSSMSKDHRTELRKTQNFAAECRGEAQIKKQIADRKNKALKDPKTLNLIFGINLEDRSHDGVFVYNCSRLIKMYEKVGPQTEGGVNCSGVVGIVDVPYLVLEPTHNKQDFADAKEYRHLLKAMGEHMVQFWKDVGIVQQGVTKFWENFGYISSNWKDPPSMDVKYLRKRAMQMNVTLQCDMCLKWRTLPFSSNNIGKDFPDDWFCAMNPDQQHNKCSSVEQKLNIPEGFLKKETKSQEQKKKDLEEEIRKKQDMLEKMQRSKAVKSNREALALEQERIKREEERKEIEQMERERKEEQRKEQERKEKERKERERRDKEKRERNREREEEKRDRERQRKEEKRRTELARAKREREKMSKQKQIQKAKKLEQSLRTKLQLEPKQKPALVRSSPKPTHQARTVASVKAAKLAEAKKGSSSSKAEAVKRKASSVSSPADSDVEEAPVNKDKNKASSPEPEQELELEPEPEPEPDEVVPAKKQKTQSTDSDTDSPKKQPKPGIFSPSNPESASVHDENEADGKRLTDGVAMDTEEEPEKVCIKDADSNGEIGTRVEAHVNNKWLSGVVVKVNPTDAKWKIKLDNNSKDKHDKWFDKNGSDIRILKSGQTTIGTTNGGPPSPASISSHDTATETPTSSTATPAAITSQITDEIGNGYRTCLRYFLPPQWIMDKDTISAMSLQELAAFPLDDFFDHYEKGLRRLVSNFQTEASVRKQESEDAQGKLSSVRKLIAKLLKSINEEFDIDPESDGDQVDELLAACVRQAMQSQS
ncbi:ATPase MORC2-like [Gigantopelta aegis]|uniref:ATPase MORC2-like n=1 Tax=Gigantopelta aegis TaxID=1735272 RepID=UPI001B88D87D|nr:ATPase MORC2-like [Gigantopelta aegis]XP_041348982.1 ATPase MORC2-like [Gigantopelta aegis]